MRAFLPGLNFLQIKKINYFLCCPVVGTASIINRGVSSRHSRYCITYFNQMTKKQTLDTCLNFTLKYADKPSCAKKFLFRRLQTFDVCCYTWTCRTHIFSASGTDSKRTFIRNIRGDGRIHYRKLWTNKQSLPTKGGIKPTGGLRIVIIQGGVSVYTVKAGTRWIHSIRSHLGFEDRSWTQTRGIHVLSTSAVRDGAQRHSTMASRTVT